MGIGFDDHLIFGKQTFISLRQTGFMGKTPSSTY
jgi:DNA repair protein RadC